MPTAAISSISFGRRAAIFAGLRFKFGQHRLKGRSFRAERIHELSSVQHVSVSSSLAKSSRSPASLLDMNYDFAECATIEMIVRRQRICKRIHTIYNGMQLQLLKLP